jgi:hypothetical protein
MGAVPTGLGSIFLGLPHGLRRGLYHVAPSGLGVWWFRLRLLLEILFLRDEGGVVFRRRRWWWRLVAWVLRWESPAEPRTPLPQDDKVPRGVLGRRRWFAASSAFWLPGRKFGVPCRNGWGGGVWLD